MGRKKAWAYSPTFAGRCHPKGGGGLQPPEGGRSPTLTAIFPHAMFLAAPFYKFSPKTGLSPKSSGMAITIVFADIHQVGNAFQVLPILLLVLLQRCWVVAREG